MKTSTDRTLTTHVGSLPRPDSLVDFMIAEDQGKSFDETAFETALTAAVKDVVQRQNSASTSSRTENSASGASRCMRTNGSGASNRRGARGITLGNLTRSDSFPEFYASEAAAKDRKPTQSSMQMSCTGPITYKGQKQLDRDLANLRAACDAAGVEEAFMPAISPSDVVGNQLNEFYGTEEEFLTAVADALNEEYRAIVDPVSLQIDDPRLINYYVKTRARVEDCRSWAEEQVEAINYSLEGIPADRIRYHTCYGINMGRGFTTWR